MLAYIGFLSLEAKISAESLPQYISAVSRYHVLHSLRSPTQSPLVTALVRAYARRFNDSTPQTPLRIGCPATVVRSIVEYGIRASSTCDLACCSAVVIAFIFQVRAVSMAHLTADHMTINDQGLTVSFLRRKGKSLRRPLILRYARSPSWGPDNPISLITKWLATVSGSEPAFSVSLTDALQRALILTSTQPPEGCIYSAHSLRIGGYNELSVLQFSKEFMMRRLDWESEAMLRVYHDSRIIATDHSRWFFAHLRP